MTSVNVDEMKIVGNFRFELTKNQSRVPPFPSNPPPHPNEMKIVRELACGDYILYPPWIPSSSCCKAKIKFCSLCKGSYTLHWTGSGTGTGDRMGTIENNGPLYLSLSPCNVYSTYCNIETHHFQFPVLPPVPCSVNKP